MTSPASSVLLPPSALYGRAQERGFTFDAYMPANRDETLAFRVVVSRGEQALFETHLPMVYPPMFGVDVGDAHALDAALDELLELLPANEQQSLDWPTLQSRFDISRLAGASN